MSEIKMRYVFDVYQDYSIVDLSNKGAIIFCEEDIRL